MKKQRPPLAATLLSPLLLCLAADAGFGSKRKQESYYTAQAQLARDYQLQRPEHASLSQGSAAQAYQQAWDVCVPVAGFGKGKERDVGTRQISSAVRALRPGQRVRPRRTPLPESCVALGAEAEDPLFSVMQAQGCELVASCQGAVALIAQGSMRAQVGSAVGPYEQWRVQGEVGRPSGEFLVLARVSLIDAWMSGGRQDPALMAERSLAVLRFGRDLGQGADGSDLRVSVGVQDLALQMLYRVIQDPKLEPVLALHIAQELEYVHLSPVDLSQTVRVDFLESTAAIWSATRPRAKALEQAPLLVAPGGPAWNPDAWELPKAAGPVVRGYLGDQHFPAWSRLVDGFGSAYLKNEAVLSATRAGFEVPQDAGTLQELQGMVANGLAMRLDRMERWNRDLGLIESRVCLLATAARARAGEPGGGCAVDPMLERPWGQDGDTQGVLLWAPALEELELTRGQQAPLEIDVRFWVAGEVGEVPAAAPGGLGSSRAE